MHTYQQHSLAASPSPPGQSRLRVAKRCVGTRDLPGRERLAARLLAALRLSHSVVLVNHTGNYK